PTGGHHITSEVTMIDKTRLGLSCFDERYGGLYRKRAALCVGRKGSGKTLLGVQALLQSVKEGERGLMLSAWRAHDLTITTNRLGLPLADAIDKGQVILLECANLISTPTAEKGWMLPPGSFLELQEIITSNSVSRVIIDTILPWVAIQPEKKLAQHVFSFVQAFERMGVTALFTLPRPVSPLAFALKNRLEEQIPIVFTLDYDEATGRRTLLINKYLGDLNLPPPMELIIAPGTGLMRAPKLVPTPQLLPMPVPKSAKVAKPPPTKVPLPTPAPTSPAVSESAVVPGAIRFASVFRT
ncbi:MAG: ATPase domain-containing protein, partial [Kiritimatiellia bacterium]